MIEIVLAVSAISLVSVAILNKTKTPVSNNNRENTIKRDFEIIKKAVIEYKEKKKFMPSDLADLEEIIGNRVEKKKLKHLYELSDSGTELLVKKILLEKELIKLEKSFDQTLKYRKSILYIPFKSTNKEIVDPVAKIEVTPSEDIYTTSNVKFTSEGSITHKNQILEEEWQGIQERYKEEGIYTIRLRIKDKHEVWSKWCEKIIHVKRQKGIQGFYGSFDNLAYIQKDGEIYVSGNNAYKQILRTDEIAVNSFSLVEDLENIKQISFGDGYGLYLTSNGHIYASGKNNLGQLGLGSISDFELLTKIPKLNNIKQIDSTMEWAAALDLDGNVYTWGKNSKGQLGDNSKVDKYNPVKINIKNARQVSVGRNHAAAVMYNGTMMTWGYNNHGQLGDLSKMSRLTPGYNVIDNSYFVCCGSDFTLFITNHKRVYGFGSNDYSQLGIEGDKEYLKPVEIVGLKEIKDLKTSFGYCVAISELGEVFVWGKWFDEIKVITTPKKLEEIKSVRDVILLRDRAYAISSEYEVWEWNNKETTPQSLGKLF